METKKSDVLLAIRVAETLSSRRKTKKDQAFVAQVLARLDRANDGVTLPEAIDMVQQLDPALSRQQAR